MGEYHDFYLKSDILLLADVFENFRSTCLQYYKLDPAHYFTSPGLSWSAMLKMTGIKLRLMTDVDQFQFIEKGMRGSISYIANRHLEANNPYMKSYSPKKKGKYIMYLDANDLYGWVMSQALLKGGFKWLAQEDKYQLEIKTIVPDSNKGLILKVDLEYPSELHNLHNDYPCAPEKMKVTKDMLSGRCRQILDKYNISIGQVSKLIPTLQMKRSMYFTTGICNSVCLWKDNFFVSLLEEELKLLKDRKRPRSNSRCSGKGLPNHVSVKQERKKRTKSRNFSQQPSYIALPLFP